MRLHILFFGNLGWLLMNLLRAWIVRRNQGTLLLGNLFWFEFRRASEEIRNQRSQFKIRISSSSI